MVQLRRLQIRRGRSCIKSPGRHSECHVAGAEIMPGKVDSVERQAVGIFSDWSFRWYWTALMIRTLISTHADPYWYLCGH